MEQQIELTQQVPRVRFNNAPPMVHDPLPRLIVASPRKRIVEPQPKPILKLLKYIDESIAARVQAQRLQSQTTVNESIAKWVARRRQEAANAVLDQDTGQLLRYHRLLTSEEQNFDLAKLIFIRVRYVHADPINSIS